MRNKAYLLALLAACGPIVSLAAAPGHMGSRLPSEKRMVIDPVTGIPLTFLTSSPAGDSKIYQTHRQWTADGKWVVFRSHRSPGQAFAVNEATGAIVQVTETGYMGMLCLARLSMDLYIMRDMGHALNQGSRENTGAAGGAAQARAGDGGPRSGRGRPHGPFQIVDINLAALIADSEAGTVRPAAHYERVCGTIASELNANGNMGLDANEDRMYFSIRSADLAQRLPTGVKPAESFGPRGMGAGPSGLASMDLKTGEVKNIVAVPFQIGHVQTNPWVPGEIVFCWETGGKAPQRTWTVMADGTGLRPLYREAPYEWVTHEAVITRDEVAIAIMGHRKPGTGVTEPDPWGPSGTREHPTGLGVVNLRTHEMRIIGQTASGSGLWHVNGSADGRWAVGDDFSRSIFLIDRRTGEMMMLSTGHKPTAADHPHPTFNASGTEIEIESAMLSADDRSMNICIIPVPKTWLQRTYPNRVPE